MSPLRARMVVGVNVRPLAPTLTLNVSAWTAEPAKRAKVAAATRGEEPANLNVKNGMKTAVANPLEVVVSMWCVYSAIRRTSSTSHWILVSDPGRRHRYYNCCKSNSPSKRFCSYVSESSTLTLFASRRLPPISKTSAEVKSNR